MDDTKTPNCTPSPNMSRDLKQSYWCLDVPHRNRLVETSDMYWHCHSRKRLLAALTRRGSTLITLLHCMQQCVPAAPVQSRKHTRDKPTSSLSQRGRDIEGRLSGEWLPLLTSCRIDLLMPFLVRNDAVQLRPQSQRAVLASR